jgi:hypothetical protein
LIRLVLDSDPQHAVPSFVLGGNCNAERPGVARSLHKRVHGKDSSPEIAASGPSRPPTALCASPGPGSGKAGRADYTETARTPNQA